MAFVTPRPLVTEEEILENSRQWLIILSAAASVVATIIGLYLWAKKRRMSFFEAMTSFVKVSWEDLMNWLSQIGGGG